MLEVPLHAGVEHANLSWVVLAGLLSFVAGAGLGIYSARFREFARAIAQKAEA